MTDVSTVADGRRPAESASPVEGHHAAGDGHVAGHLGRHAADQHHLLARVRVEGRVVERLGAPQLVLRQLQRLAGPSERRTESEDQPDTGHARFLSAGGGRLNTYITRHSCLTLNRHY